MKKFLLLTLVIFIASCATKISQGSDYNTKDGYIAQGYDVTEYFNNRAVKGVDAFSTGYNGVKYRFVNQENLDTFKASPDNFVPQYGGYCAYAVAEGTKVGINPETFEIRDDKLYLFYNSWGNNTLESWNEEGAEKLREKADLNWKAVSSYN